MHRHSFRRPSVNKAIIAGAKTTILTVVCICLLVPPLWAVDSRGAIYTGGTIPDLKDKSEGRFTHSEDAFTFSPNAKGAKPVHIPYASVDELEYGQKAGRRVAVGVLISPLALFSKKRNHYLTISFKDANGKDQAGVFELGKDIVRTTLKILETRTGKPIQFQDDEARRSLGGGKS
jgi:hypothetical protein